MADLHIYQVADFQPILLPGETVHLVTASGERDVVVKAVGALPEYVHDFGSVTGTTWTLNQSPNVLEMNTGELAQFRVRVLADIQLYLKNPASTEQWRGTNQKFFLPKYPEDDEVLRRFMFAASEFFVWKDEYPTWDIYPYFTSTKTPVAFSGYRFSTRPSKVPGKVTLYVNSWPSGQAS